MAGPRGPGTARPTARRAARPAPRARATRPRPRRGGHRDRRRAAGAAVRRRQDPGAPVGPGRGPQLDPLPDRQARQQRLGHAEIHLDHLQVVQRGDGGAAVQHLPLDQVGQADDAGKRGAQQTVLQQDLGAVAFGLRAQLGRAGGLKGGVRRRSAGIQLFLAGKGGVGLGQGRLGGGQIGLFGAVVQFQQDIAAFDLRAGAKGDAGDAAARLGHQLDRAAGTRGADGADAVDEPGGLDGHGLDRHRLSGAVGRAAGLFGFAQQTVRQRHAPGGRGDDHDGADGCLDEAHGLYSPVTGLGSVGLLPPLSPGGAARRLPLGAHRATDNPV